MITSDAEPPGERSRVEQHAGDRYLERSGSADFDLEQHGLRSGHPFDRHAGRRRHVHVHRNEPGRNRRPPTTVKVDQTAPTLNGAAVAPPNANGWYKAPVTIHWSCSDALSGVAGPCPADSVVSSEGERRDGLGVGERRRRQHDGLDECTGEDRHHRAGTAASTLPEWNNSTVTLQLSATDGLSGVDTTYYTVDGGTTQTGTSVLLVDEGVHHVNYWSVDNAGNIEDRTPRR